MFKISISPAAFAAIAETLPLGSVAVVRAALVLDLFVSARYRLAMPDDKLTPASPEDVADSISFALLWSRGRKRVHDSEAMTAALAADRIVSHLERSGYVILKKPPASGAGDMFRGMRND
jgi:hypothetical protein